MLPVFSRQHTIIKIGRKTMCMKILKLLYNNKQVLALFLLVFLYTSDAYAVFEELNKAGESIFSGLKSIVIPAGLIGMACCCIAGMFGNFNWKWFAAIALGMFVMYAIGSGSDSLNALSGSQ